MHRAKRKAGPWYVAVLVVVLAVAAAGMSLAAGSGTKKIHGCVNKQTKLVRIISVNKSCKANEISKTWNMRGRRGAIGATGADGPAGTNGAVGADGATGPTGPAGADGIDGIDGIDGVTGPTGPTGPDGATGPIGPTGADGIDGADGVTGPTGPTGADGATGPTGPTGSMGPSGSITALTIVSNTSASNSNDKSITATCTGGQQVLGGGYVITGSVDVTAASSYPSSATVWTVSAVEADPESGNWSVTAYAICA